MAAADLTLLRADSDRLLTAVRGLLAAKGILTAEDIAERIRTTDQASPAQGARMVARAWVDPAYRALMLRNGTEAAEQLGIPMRGAPPLGVLADEPGLHHLVVCTLCSCYPRAVLGYPPFLAEWRTELPSGTAIRVVDSTADYRWMVLPLRPAGTETWTEERLAGLVSEGDMIGVTIPIAERS